MITEVHRYSAARIAAVVPAIFHAGGFELSIAIYHQEPTYIVQLENFCCFNATDFDRCPVK